MQGPACIFWADLTPSSPQSAPAKKPARPQSAPVRRAADGDEASPRWSSAEARADIEGLDALLEDVKLEPLSAVENRSEQLAPGSELL
jgi:hypothetical protein